MVDKRFTRNNDEQLPLHELLSYLLAKEESSPGRSGILRGLGTMQQLNQRLANQPVLDFINYTLRGFGQAVFANNPISGLILLVALAIQSPWLALMSLIGVISSTMTGVLMKQDRESIRNGVFGFQGFLVGGALATVGLSGNGTWNPIWVIATILLSAITTVLGVTLGVWFVTKFRVAALVLPFLIVITLFLLAVSFLPQPYFHLGSPPPAATTSDPLDWSRLPEAGLSGFGALYFTDQLLTAILVFVAIGICSPQGAILGLLGSFLGVLGGVIIGVPANKLYAGLWGYNGILVALAIGGMFFAPNRRSIFVAAVCAFVSGIACSLLGLLFSPLGLPIFNIPFCLVTIGCLLVLQRSLPSLVPIALYTVTSPEEHRQRFVVARDIITNFRRQLEAAMTGKRRNFLFDKASDSIQRDLRYAFNAIDTSRNGTLSTQELAVHLRQAGKVSSEGELAYLFTCMDVDGSGEIDFEEFGELMLRHRRLMSRYAEFVTYFLPIDADQDDSISIKEMNIAMASVSEPPLTADEIAFLEARAGRQPLTWNRFIEVLLVT